MLTWRNVLIACVTVAYLAWSANQLWHDSHEKPVDGVPVQCEPVAVGVEVMV
jgi:hypothetical protein